MEDYHLTPRILLDACKNHKYFLIRYPNGKCFGINAKMVKKSFEHYNRSLDDEFIYSGYKPISLNEYINIKVPLIKVATE